MCVMLPFTEICMCLAAFVFLFLFFSISFYTFVASVATKLDTAQLSMRFLFIIIGWTIQIVFVPLVSEIGNS